MVNGIQAMEIQQGLNGLTSGTYEGVQLIHCTDDGSITVHGETVTLEAGSDRSLKGSSVEILSGTFDINK